MSMHIKIFVLSVLPAIISTTVTAAPIKTPIEATIKQIGLSVPGVLGVATLHLENGNRIEINANQPFPMASTYKLPIALYALSLVDSKKLDLNTQKKITAHDIRSFCFVRPNQKLSIKELVRLSIEKSDNATPDILLKMVGGGSAVTAWLVQHGIISMRVDRSCLKMVADYCGISNLGDEFRCTLPRYRQLLKQIGPKKARAAAQKFYDDTRDTATPRAMVDLLERLHAGKLASPTSTKFVLDCMAKCCIWRKTHSRITP